MTPKPLILFVALAAVLLARCTSPETGTAQFAVSARQALASNISRVTVTSSAADIPSVTVELAQTHGLWGGIIGNIPAGSNRAFHAQAFDASGALLFEGTASGVTISESQTTLVAITLQEVNAPPPLDNEAPIIDSLVATATTVAPGGNLVLQATAHDPNPGDTLTYAWSSTAGTFSASTSDVTGWIAPLTLGAQRLTLTVTDPGGLSSSISLNVNVATSGPEGEAQLSITFNSSPRLAWVSASPTQLSPGQTTSVSVAGTDPDEDGLSYSWSATCAGAWANASSSSAQFTPSALPAVACNNCRLTVSVSDGRGGQTTGTVALCVSDTPPINHFPPVIIRSYRSSDTATAGQELTYEVEARDPENSALTFSWAASTGSLGAPAHGTSHSRITWTAPSCLDASTAVTVTVTNASHLMATRTFTVSGLPACSNAGWSPAGSLTLGRLYHSATVLPGGRVLTTGGRTNNGTLDTSELYEPVSNTWRPTSPMLMPRERHSATLLLNGKVLVTAGESYGEWGYSENVTAAELYDPASGSWSMTGSLASPRDQHTATRLTDGRVLVTGGRPSNGSISAAASAEVYDPASGTWSATGSMITRRSGHRATLLSNGKVMVSGGQHEGTSLSTAEVYDPASGTWSATGSLAEARYDHTATLLPNGKVLVTGGYGAGAAIATSEVYDPATGTWSATPSMSVPRIWHTATLLPNGKVLVAGGFNFLHYELATAEVYDPVTSTWSSTPSMASRRRFHVAALMPDGKVLVVSGNGWEGQVLGTLASSELYTP
ncbi:kelch repeat-containing protein [Hyalangium minutum]|uniref:High-affinity leucine-specific transport system, periplasmic binding protein LivK n=1 Tax=Hyalangium minutum TaxID=394096 RepID=A0A085WWF4_9BACT|nr:kelch repeat-containing protein [Hyalangium minutum]KFE72017.1 High-affinity leucine-specific transport system, periplasmic binding protein LivK [Hyalangium minutum]